MIYDYEFDIIELEDGGRFSPENKTKYETVVKNRGANGWRLCTGHLIIISGDGDQRMGFYLTWERFSHIHVLPEAQEHARERIQEMLKKMCISPSSDPTLT